jgi:4-diphosphocytidyl-2-C-methyl-D-erythritol kinase
MIRVKALAKINLDLRVLGPRADGYHELRTVFQTISLADTLEIAFTAGRRTSIGVVADVEILGKNLVERSAELALEGMGKSGRVEIRLRKRIPLGAGLGGGSSDAAAVLLALPVLAQRRIELDRLLTLAERLGSDVPFFLLGGTALALGRGTQLYALEDRPAGWGVVVTPGIHVSTAEAYQELDRARKLTSGPGQNMISTFQSYVWDAGGVSGNDFEPVVFSRHPRLKSLKRKLERLGAQPARLSGSGSAIYGLFGSREEAERARQSMGKEQALPIRLVSRRRYRSLWWGQLGTERIWPPQSRYE